MGSRDPFVTDILDPPDVYREGQRTCQMDSLLKPRDRLQIPYIRDNNLGHRFHPASKCELQCGRIQIDAYRLGLL